MSIKLYKARCHDATKSGFQGNIISYKQQ